MGHKASSAKIKANFTNFLVPPRSRILPHGAWLTFKKKSIDKSFNSC